MPHGPCCCGVGGDSSITAWSRRCAKRGIHLLRALYHTGLLLRTSADNSDSIESVQHSLPFIPRRGFITEEKTGHFNPATARFLGRAGRNRGIAANAG